MRQIIRLIQYDKEDDKSTIREEAMLMTLAKTASRRGEYLDLTLDDINLNRYEIYWPNKKKRKERSD